MDRRSFLAVLVGGVVAAVAGLDAIASTANPADVPQSPAGGPVEEYAKKGGGGKGRGGGWKGRGWRGHGRHRGWYIGRRRRRGWRRRWYGPRRRRRWRRARRVYILR
jgi:hypothetical protein